MVAHLHMAVLLLAASTAAQAPAPPPPDPPRATDGTFGPACGLEVHPHWAMRAIACMRLERSAESGAISMLRSLSRDPDPRVRAFAVTARFLRKDPPTADVILADPDRRVLRAALRCGLHVDPEELATIVQPLLRPEDREECLLGVELSACIDHARLRHRAVDALGRVIMRFDRAGAGASTPRLETLLDASGGWRPTDWQRHWQDMNPRQRTLACPMPSHEHALALAGDADFASFAAALRAAIVQPIDLAICMDSSASMFADLPRAQALGDRLGRSLADLVPGSRVAVVGYRDRKSDFITQAFPFEASIPAWRTALWGFAADKGGSAPEAVLEGLRVTYSLAWDPMRRNIVVLIGDGTPHIGTRGLCAEAAAEARTRARVTTHVVSALPEGAVEAVDGFPEIAAAGGGHHLRITASQDLPSLLLGPEFSDTHRALMAAFRERCDLVAR